MLSCDLIKALAPHAEADLAVCVIAPGDTSVGIPDYFAYVTGVSMDGIVLTVGIAGESLNADDLFSALSTRHYKSQCAEICVKTDYHTDHDDDWCDILSVYVQDDIATAPGEVDGPSVFVIVLDE